MPVVPTPLPEVAGRADHPLRLRFPFDRIAALPGLAPVDVKTKEGELVRLRAVLLWVVSPAWPTEVHQAGLLRLILARDRPGGVAGLSGGELWYRGRLPRGSARIGPRFQEQETMRLSQVPVQSLCRHGLLFDPGGVYQGSPVAPWQLLRSGSLKPSAFPFGRSGTCRRVILMDHDFQTTFEAQSHTLPIRTQADSPWRARSTPLTTFISSSRKALLLGWWLAFAQRGLPPPGLPKPISAGSHPRFPRLRVYLGTTTILLRDSFACPRRTLGSSVRSPQHSFVWHSSLSSQHL